MCDPGLIIGLGMGALKAAGAASTAASNQKMIAEEAAMKQGAQERTFLVENNAAAKQKYDASQEADRNKSFLKALSGSQGATVGARNAEQSRQGALSINKAQDRTEAASANYAFSGKETQIAANNQIATEAYSPLSAFTDIAGSGISNYGAFN